MAEFEQNLSQFGQAIAIDTGFTPSCGGDQCLNGTERARGANRVLPQCPVIVSFDVRHLYAGSMVSRVKALSGDLAIREKRLPIRDASHLQALKFYRFKPLPQNKFGAAAANVYHEPSVLIVRQGMGDTEVNQTSFLTAIDDINGCSQNLLRRLNELLTIFCAAQRVGANYADFGGGSAIYQLLEALQALQAPSDRSR